ncbi:MAG: hypothetical protein Terrestrivirus8_9 [Terrestrivirus sp.]|uniref:CD-NTase-associated protein 12/Pycsar effector protein TIR domain-containing protein n=1 Tax=Terrestrivirus sp. TaxID=2487775 RepID=A0A3G4ZNQ9_9VIRU|nr:MAG: hypothetical protein Terrestrivirus8_9 [Terrestrivirus sp.]
MNNLNKHIMTLPILFFSWQSDIPNDFKNIVQKACKDIVKYDEATREVSGSPNIPETIKQKIKNCDIFICDMSVINYHDTTNDKRKCQNPNVLFELGYAHAVKEQEEIISICCDDRDKTNLPFDYTNYRVSVIKGSENQQIGDLKFFIKSVIENTHIKFEKIFSDLIPHIEAINSRVVGTCNQDFKNKIEENMKYFKFAKCSYAGFTVDPSNASRTYKFELQIKDNLLKFYLSSQ